MAGGTAAGAVGSGTRGAGRAVRASSTEGPETERPLLRTTTSVPMMTSATATARITTTRATGTEPTGRSPGSFQNALDALGVGDGEHVLRPDVFELLGHDGGGPVPVHRHAVQHVGRLHGSFLVGDHQDLRRGGEAHH